MYAYNLSASRNLNQRIVDFSSLVLCEMITSMFSVAENASLGGYAGHPTSS